MCSYSAIRTTLKVKRLGTTTDVSTLLFHVGIEFAIDECGITQEKVQWVDDSCWTHAQSLCEAGKGIDDANDGLESN